MNRCGKTCQYLSRSGSSTYDEKELTEVEGREQADCAGADEHAADLPRVDRGEQAGRGPDVRPNDVRPPQIGLGDHPDQELAHRAWRQEVSPALGRAETREVDGEETGVLREHLAHRRDA